jgi:flagellum-specific ATP synthase
MSIFSDMEELIRLGAYRKGSDPNVDRAIAIYPKLEAFLGQQRDETTTIAEGYAMLKALIAEADARD